MPSIKSLCKEDLDPQLSSFTLCSQVTIPSPSNRKIIFQKAPNLGKTDVVEGRGEALGSKPLHS